MRSVVIFALMAAGMVRADDVVAKVSLTDSAPTGLAGTKKVAITSVVISFQASTGAKSKTSGMFAIKDEASTVLEMPQMDEALLGGIADELYKQLQADLQANGFEVIPQATVQASATYQEIVKMAGITNFSKFANTEGDILLVSPSGLTPYLAFTSETGPYSTPQGLIKGWTKGMTGASSTEGGPSLMKQARIYKLPGLEVDLAKELNAHVVKATYVVTLGSAKASTAGHFSTTITSKGNVHVQVGVEGGQSRVAFRTPTGKSKGQQIARTKPEPAKDGDVVVALAQSLEGGTEFFSVESTTKKGVWLNKDVKFSFTVSLTDPPGYRAEVAGLLKEAQSKMLAAVKR